MPTEIKLWYGVCLSAKDLAKVLNVSKINSTKCFQCNYTLQKDFVFCCQCGAKIPKCVDEASDQDVFSVVGEFLGVPPHRMKISLYNGYVCIGYELAKDTGIAIFDNNAQYRPWPDLWKEVLKFVDRKPISNMSHLLKPSFFAMGG
jgi:hypothetical protein